MLLWARERRHRLGDGACVFGDVTGLGRGRWLRVKGLDRGWERRRGGSREDSMMAWALGKFMAGNFGSLTT
jgi:hypothetical protein